MTRRCFGAMVVCLMIAGCSGSGRDIARVEGTVTIDGSPLAGASVVFKPVSGERLGTGRTDEEGRFTMGTYLINDGVFVGVHLVAIEARGPTRTAPGIEGPVMPGTPDAIQPGLPLIPQRYFDVATSGLTAKVARRRKNVIDFELNSHED